MASMAPEIFAISGKDTAKLDFEISTFKYLISTLRYTVMNFFISIDLKCQNVTALTLQHAILNIAHDDYNFLKTCGFNFSRLRFHDKNHLKNY